MTIRLKQSSLVTITDPVVQNGYEEALSPYFSDCRIHTELDLNNKQITTCKQYVGTARY
jgi:hypothetical protein